MKLVQEGGIVVQSVDREKADAIAKTLKNLGVTVRIDQEEDPLSGRFRIVLDDPGDKKIQVIKVVRQITGLGLKDAKELVDRSGVVAEYNNRDRAEKGKKKLIEAGAEARIEDSENEDPEPVIPMDSEEFVVYGYVFLKDGKPATGLRVAAYDRDLRTEELLGEARVGAKGDYVITYRTEQFHRSEKGGADLVVRVFSNTQDPLVSEVNNRELPLIDGEAILFNASSEEEISLEVTRPKKKKSRYEVLDATLRPILDGAAPYELSGRDVQFLYHESGQDISEIQFYAEDGRLSEKTGMPLSVFYALAMREIGLDHSKDDDMFRMDLSIVAAVDVVTLMKTVKEAITSNLIPKHLKSNLDAIKQRFEFIRKRFLHENHDVQRRKLHQVSQLSGLNSEAEQILSDRFLYKSKERTTDPVEELKKEGVLNEAQAGKVRLCMDLDRLTGSRMELVERIVSQPISGVEPIESLQDLASLDQSKWKKVIQESGAEISDEEEVDRIANQLRYEIEGRFPTSAVEYRIVKQDYTPVLNQLGKVEVLMDRNEKLFERLYEGTLTLSEIDLGDISETETEEIQEGLRELKRVSSTFSRLGAAEVLDNQELSADQKLNEINKRIKAVGSFLENNRELDVKSADMFGLAGSRKSKPSYKGIDKKMQPIVRKQIMAFQRVLNLAPDTKTAQQLMAEGFDSAARIQSVTPSVLSGKTGLSMDIATTVYKRANSVALESKRVAHNIAVEHENRRLEPLFTTLSPGVDTELRKIDGYEDLFGPQNYCSCDHCASIFGPIAYFVDLMRFVDKHVLTSQLGGDSEHLLHLNARRPDLWEMDLDCEAATKLIPTLTVVNEILEHYVATIDDEPESEWAEAAYQKLSEAKHSFLLPFHRPLMEIRVYLDHLGMNLSDIVELLHGSDDRTVYEYLTLSKETAALILEPDTTDERLEQLYSTPSANFSELPVPLMQKVTGLERDSLSRLLALPVIRRESNLFIDRQLVEGTTNRYEETVKNLTPEILDRIHRFVRLFGALPWKLEEADYMIRKHAKDLFDQSSSLQDRKDALQRVATLVRIQKQMGVSVDQLQSMVGDVPVEAIRPGHRSLFDRRFNPEQMSPDTSEKWNFEDSHLFKHDLFDVSEDPLELDKNYYRLLEATRLAENDFETLLQRVLDGEAADDGFTFELTYNNLSSLIRYAELVRSLDLSPSELFNALELLDKEGGDDAHAGLDTLSQLLEFLSWADQSRFSIDQMYGVIKGEETEWPEERVRDLLRRAYEFSLETTFTDELFTDLGDDLSGVEVDILVRILLENGTIEEIGGGETDDIPRFRVAPDFDPEEELDLSFEDDTQNSEHESSLDELKSLEQSIRKRLIAHLPEEAAVREIASAFDLPMSVFDEICSFTALQRSERSDWLDLITLPQNGNSLENSTLQFFKDVERVLRWVEPLGLSPSEVRFIARNPKFFDLEKGQNPLLETVRKLSVYTKMKRQSNEERLFHHILLSESRDIELMAEYFDATPSYVQSFTDQIPLPGNDSDGASTTLDRLLKLFECIKVAKRIGVNGRTLNRLTSNSYETLKTAHEAVIAAFKSSYDNLEEFERELRSSQDSIREKRRDALVEYMLTHPNLSFDTTRDIYNHLLIDTEVAGCNDTSRVVQATKSVQLYVHRCMMGLEVSRPGVENPVRITPSSEMREEWRWRKNYRVWEANRKVFVYPENYLDPDIRDNKTPQFEEVEQALLQQDVTQEHVEKAYRGYLEKLQDLGSLTVHSACYHEEEEAYYFIGRTSREDSRYYVRKMSYIGDAAGWKSIVYDSTRPVEWGHWEEIDLKIKSPIVTPYFYRGRLYLFWVDAQPEKKTGIEAGSSVDEGTIYKIVLNVAYRTQDGSWSESEELDLFKDERFGDTQIVVPDMNANNWEGPDLDEMGNDFDDPFEREFRRRLEKTWYKVYPFIHENELHIGYRDPDIEKSKMDTDWTPRFFHLDLFNGKATNVTRKSELEDQGPSIYLHLTDYLGANGVGYNLVTYVRDYLNDFDVDHALHAEYEESRRNKLDVTERSDDFKVYNEFTSFNDQTNLLTIHGAPGSVLFQLNNQLYFLEQQIDAFLLFPVPNWRVWPMTTHVVDKLGQILLTRGIDGFLSPETSGSLEDDPFPLTASAAPLLEYMESFGENGPFTIYYRELFLHLPLLIAKQLNSAGDFEAAQRWYHYIFDPTTNEDPPSESEVEEGMSPAAHYWRFPEFKNTSLFSAESMMGNDEAIGQYRRNPFSPHAIARIRTRAYQKSVVMDYVTNLLDWGDDLFSRDSRESINEATMLYAMAADILGPRPEEIGACETIERVDGPASFGDLQIEGEFDISVENLVVSSEADGERSAIQRDSKLMMQMKSTLGDQQGFQDRSMFAGGRTIHSSLLLKPGSLASANTNHQVSAASMMPATQEAFCLPVNEHLLGFWDRVEDRLFKIRNCMNIDGETRSLALFEPPIDPMMMVKARAAGLSLRDALAMGVEGPPLYRFEVLLGRAKSYVSTVQNFGKSLLSALEKKDVEELRQLQSTHQRNIMNLTTDIKNRQVKMEQENLEALRETRKVTKFRKEHYETLLTEGLSVYEKGELSAMGIALELEIMANQFNTMGSLAHGVPQVGAPTSMNYGGREVGAVLTSLGGAFANMSKRAQFGASLESRLGSYHRRDQGWEFQKQLAQKELERIDKQILAGEIRIAMAERQLLIHEESIEQAEELFEFYEEKFTNLGLYTWLSSEMSRMYRVAYNMAHEVALMAQRAYQYERDDNTMFIESGHWDIGRAGLLAGEKLLLQLQRLEKTHLETNRRDYEVDQTFSLSQFNPLALQKLRESGTCQFNVPELFYDLAYPGQYNRKITSVRLTIPCVAGPYVNVNAKLTLLQSRIRKEAKLDTDSTTYLITEHRSRNQSIATSSGKNDGGVFSLDFRSSRYLPFEGAGAVSEWRLELPKTFRSFDYNSIADALIHISYTAKEDGQFREDVEEGLYQSLNSIASETGIQRVIHIGEEFATQYRHLFRGLENPDVETQSVSFKIGYRHFPYFLNGKKLDIGEMGVALKLKKEWAGLFEDDQTDFNSVGITLKSESGESEITFDGSLERMGESSVFSRHPYGSFEMSSDPVPVLAEGTNITLELNRSDLQQLCRTLFEKAGEPLGEEEVTAERIDQIVEDLYLVLGAQVSPEDSVLDS